MNAPEEPPEEVLAAQIRMAAHGLDKLLQLAPSRPAPLPDKPHQQLAEKLGHYALRYDTARPDYRWAVRIHELYGLALADRDGFAYPYGPKPAGGPSPEAFEELVKSRRSVREFTDQPIPDATVERLIGLAGHEKIMAFVWLGNCARAPLPPARRRLAEIVRYL